MDPNLLHKKWDDTPPLHELQRNVHRIITTFSVRAVLRNYVFCVHTLLILLWIWLLHWGEVRVYDKDVRSCRYGLWERWPEHATPHRVAFVADPQLVDPHTYPGRPWPLSSLTIAFTDKYLERSFRTLERNFDPDTIYFLGDLFDGGREWSTGGDFQVTDPRWRNYGRKVWQREYKRFADIFFKDSQISGGRLQRKSKNIIASLPGNHDLGFAAGIQLPVRQRFQAYFGEGDRVDVIGNHTFVGLDTVSLSAIDVAEAHPLIWQPANEFLEHVEHKKKQATHAYLTRESKPVSPYIFEHGVSEPVNNQIGGHNPLKKHTPGPDLPTILLSHVPLYRDPGTKCGWLREKYPPATLDEFEERNAIRVAAGYQYQNVLTKQVTKNIAEKVGNIDYAFSGDDHDYCEVTHRAYPSAGRGIHEITVKSFSFAMGIERPGFVLASLWNPIDEAGKPLTGSPGALRNPTLHSHLCLLPNQLAVFIQYAFYLIVTLMILLTRSAFATLLERNPTETAVESYLPLSEPSSKSPKRDESEGRTVSISGVSEGKTLSARPGHRGRNSNPLNGVGGYGLPSVDDYDAKKKDDSWSATTRAAPKKGKKLFIVQWGQNLLKDLAWVAGPSLAWFIWLWRNT